MSAFGQLLIGKLYPVSGVRGVFVESGGVPVSSAMTMRDAAITSGTTQYVYSRGVTSAPTVTIDGMVRVLPGGSAADVLVDRGWCFNSGLCTGGPIVTGGGFFNCNAPGVTMEPRISSGFVGVFGGTVSGGDMYAGSTGVYAYAGVGGTVDGLRLHGGQMAVSSGGTANGCLFYPGGSAVVSAGGTATAASILGGWVAVRSLGELSGATLSGGQIIAYYGGRVAGIAILAGNMPVWAPAPFGASDVTIRGGNANVGYGGYASGVEVSSGGSLIMSAGSASNVTVSSGGILTISSGGSALAVTSNAGAVIKVLDGGYIEYA